jgi:hypothetical protein
MIQGVDISSHNGLFDFKKAYAASVKLCYAKASQRDFADPSFNINMANSEGSGVQMGAYHFIDHSPTHYIVGQEVEFGKLQARKFLEMVLPYVLKGTLKVTVKIDGVDTDATFMCDLEQAYDWPKLDYTNQIRAYKICGAFAQKVEEGVLDATGKKMNCGLYGSQYLMQTPNPFVKRLPPWLAWYTALFTPAYKYIRSDGSIYYATGQWKGKWLLHQFTSTADGRLYGNSVGNDKIDLNNLNPEYPLVTSEDEPVVIPVEINDTEKLARLWDAHPDIHT